MVSSKNINKTRRLRKVKHYKPWGVAPIPTNF